MKNFGCEMLLGLSVVMMVACDSGGESAVEANRVVIPPENISEAANVNPISPTISGAEVSLEGVYQSEILEKINADRAAVSLNTLVSDSRLISLGQQHNLYLAQQAQASGSSEIEISHDNFNERAEDAFDYGYNLVGENVGGIRGIFQRGSFGCFLEWLE